MLWLIVIILSNKRHKVYQAKSNGLRWKEMVMSGLTYYINLKFVRYIAHSLAELDMKCVDFKSVGVC